MWAHKRGVIGEVQGKLLVDLANARIDGVKARHNCCLGLFVAHFRGLRHCNAARRVAPLPFGRQVLPLAGKSGELRDSRSATRRHLGQQFSGF